jgi:Leishmanolysin
VDDIPRMIDEGIWDDVIVHEMGHVIGMLDLVWSAKGLVRNKGITGRWSFVGPKAMAEFGKLQDPCLGQALAQTANARGRAEAADGGGQVVPVPIEDNFGPGTIGSHWRESVFGAEMMTGFIDPGNNPLSRVTGGALGDLGYQVDLDACDSYTLPSPTALAIMGVLSAARINEMGLLGGYIERTVPRVAPSGRLLPA